MTGTDPDALGRCPTDDRCVLSGDRHADWMHVDRDGNEWPVGAWEVQRQAPAPHCEER